MVSLGISSSKLERYFHFIMELCAFQSLSSSHTTQTSVSADMFFAAIFVIQISCEYYIATLEQLLLTG